MGLHDVAQKLRAERELFADISRRLEPSEQFPRFRDARALLDLTQDQFATLVKAHRVTASDWEAHKTLPGKKRLAVVAAALEREFARQAIQTERQLLPPIPEWLELPADWVTSEFQLGTKGSLICRIVLRGPDEALTPDEWQIGLGLHRRVLKDLPRWGGDGVPEVILGWDVGISLEAAVRGLSYKQIVGRKGQNRIGAAMLGRLRLLAETHVSWALVQVGAIYGLIGTDYYRISRGAEASQAMWAAGKR
jgi:transcriptional regulator with XRE-family HTH domain